METLSQPIWRTISGIGRFVAACALFGSFALGEEVLLSYAKNFAIERLDTHQLLTVRSLWRGSGDLTFSYALVPKGAEVPDLEKDVLVVRTPVERLSILATVYLGYVQELDLYDQLVGVAHLKYTNDPRVRTQVDSGYTREIAAGNALNIESIMMLDSDVIFTSSLGDPQYDAHPHLQRARQPVVITSDYMEDHPLGRSEWIKFVAAFFGKDDEAAVVFDAIAQKYESLARRTSEIADRPTVFMNAPFGGVWYMPGGKSYTARAVRDAGGRFVFGDNASRGGVPMEFESVYVKAAQADFWLHPGQSRSLDSLRALDERFDKFEAFREKRVYNNTLRVNTEGGNDIWERGVIHPEEVLADMVAILHPELMPNHDFVFYERLK